MLTLTQQLGPSVGAGQVCLKIRGSGDLVLYLSNPAGVGVVLQGRLLDDLSRLNQAEMADPDITTRIAQYEMAYRMQASVLKISDISSKPKHILQRYGPDVMHRVSFASNCFLARRLSEQVVRFVQLMHTGWDQHGNILTQLAVQCRDTDQPSAALARPRTASPQLLHLDVRPGIKDGHVYGQFDDFSYNFARDPFHVHDFQVTILHLLGIHRERLTYKFQGRNFPLTDVHGKVVRDIIA